MSPPRRRARRPGGGLPAWARSNDTTAASLDGVAVEVRSVQPYQAAKAYACPGCHGTVAVGQGHVVVVPVDAVEDRRHWHRSCWAQRARRRPR